ncbi:MAG: hypothetical protein H7301_09795 [Cryobacterium sp.]|nr:hypothetical protein [Oligoflexia bacterium]
MEHSFRIFGDRIHQALESRVPFLSAKFRALRIPRWAFLTCLALIGTLFAHQQSQAEGRIHWLRENAPSAATWQSILFRRGFSLIEDPAWREKAVAEMPENSRWKATSLISEDRYWVALKTSGEWAYFRRGGTGTTKFGGQVVKRELWEDLGVGWAGIARIDQMDLPDIHLPRSTEPNPAISWRDSRSIEF